MTIFQMPLSVVLQFRPTLPSMLKCKKAREKVLCGNSRPYRLKGAPAGSTNFAPTLSAAASWEGEATVVPVAPAAAPAAALAAATAVESNTAQMLLWWQI